VQRVPAKQDDALESYESALASFRQAGDQLGEARCYQAMADVWRLRKDQDAALRSYEQAVNLFRQIGSQTEEAKVLEAMGDVQRILKWQYEALRSYQQALALYQEEKDRLKRAKVLKAMGDVHRLQQDQDAALESYAQALALFGELKEPEEEANVRRAMEEMQQPQSEQEALPEEKSVSQIKPPVPAAPLPAAPQQRPGFLGVWTILSIVLVLLIVTGSSALLLNLGSHAHAPAHTSTTATLQAQASTTAQAVATATEHAVATASQSLYTQITSGSPVLNDPLMDNSEVNGWDVEHTPGSDCIFTQAAYHARITTQDHFFACFAVSSNFINFAFQVQMTIIKGDVGGIVFRANDTETQFYYFGIDQDGSYFLFRYAPPVISGKNPQNNPHLAGGITSVIHTGLNQHNLLTVIARDNRLYLFVNQLYITSITDSTYSAGAIGVVAESVKNPTDVMFSNAQVWTL